MTLKFVGACLGRSSTMSLKAALQILDLQNIYHMEDVMSNLPLHAEMWMQAFEYKRSGQDKKCKEILLQLCQGQEGMIDFPACCFWKEYTEMFPDLPVLMSVRDNSTSYANSLCSTIGYFGYFFTGWFHRLLPDQVMTFPGKAMSQLSMEVIYEMVDKQVCQRKGLTNRESCIDHEAVSKGYENYVAAVRKAVPKEKLFELNAKEGWPKLVEMLKLPTPSVPYPHVNDKAAMQKVRKINWIVDSLVYVYFAAAAYFLFNGRFYVGGGMMTVFVLLNKIIGMIILEKAKSILKKKRE